MIIQIVCWVLLFFFSLGLIKIYRNIARFRRSHVKYLGLVEHLSNLSKVIFGVHSFNEYFCRATYGFPDQRFVGSFEWTSPVFLARSPQAVRTICVQKFDNFVNHRSVIDHPSDPFLSNQIFFMKDNRWRDMRSDLSPAFSIGKTKQLFNFMANNVEQWIEECKAMFTSSGMIEVDAKHLALQHTYGVFAKTLFNDNTQEIRDKLNDICQTVEPFTRWNLLKLSLLRLLPEFLAVEKLRIVPNDSLEYIRNSLKESFDWRTTKKVYIPDIIQMLLESKRGWHFDEMASQLQLLTTAYSSSLGIQISNTLHELARNSNVAEKLRIEIDEVNERVDGNLSLDDLNNMEYMDMVISESLRKWPSASLTDRLCTEDCDVGPISDNCNNNLVIRKGEFVIINIYGIQNDPAYWDKPELFDPERFSKDNKDKIIPYSFIPFGVGPRNCLANRQMMIHMKLIVYHFLLNFNLKKGKKMRDDVKLQKHTIVTCFDGGSWIEIEPRT